MNDTFDYQRTFLSALKCPIQVIGRFYDAKHTTALLRKRTQLFFWDIPIIKVKAARMYAILCV